MDVSALPHLNAGLNATATLLLLIGFGLVKSGRKSAHRAVMLSATAVSAAFLVSYLIYHANAPIFLFNGTGGLRIFYYGLLISHVVLAAAVAPMVLWTLYRALKGRFEPHKRLARWTWPMWIYVSATGILVYLMLYQFNPPAAMAGG